MTFGHGPNTFPQSAAHVLNTNNNPSTSKGVINKEIYTSAANYLNTYIQLFTGAQKDESEITHFSGSNLTLNPEREVSFKNSNDSMSKFCCFIGSRLSVMPSKNKDVLKNPSFTNEK